MKKCPICNKSYTDIEDLYLHIETVHFNLYPKDWSPARFLYSKKYGRSSGKCIVCGKETEWNESTNKPYRLCCHKCKSVYREQFKQNMIRVHGKTHLLNDPDMQKKMLMNRKISGEYIWSDGVKIPYVGQYEKDLMQFLDVFLNFESKDISSPSPQIFYYEYNGNKCFYIPDVYIESLNLIIEIKDGGNNPNTHYKIQSVDKEKEKLKDEVMLKQKDYHYIKVVNKEYGPLIQFLLKLKEYDEIKGPAFRPLVMINEHVDVLSTNSDFMCISENVEQAESILSECYETNMTDMKSMLDEIKNLDPEVL